MKLKALAASLAAIGMAYAEIAAAESERELAAMKVTADQDVPVQQRTELGKLTEATPVSGAVVTEADLEHLQVVNPLLELGKRVPGIGMIRNMRIPDGGKQYTENRVDGMRAVATNTSLLDEVDMANVERIDVITGPASALYGSGALGGTISVYTRQPPKDFEARLAQEAGSWGYQRTTGNAGATTADGRLGFVVDGSDMDNGGWRRSTAAANQDAAAEHKNGQALKVMVRPTDSMRVTLGYDTLHYDYRWAGTLRMSKWQQDWRQVEAGTYGQSIDDYETTTLRVQQLVGERGEFSFAYGRVRDDSTSYGGAGSGGANNVICDDPTGGVVLAAGKTVKCRLVNGGSSASTNTLKKGNTTAETTTVVYRHEFDVAKSTFYVGSDMFEVDADSATYNNVYTALQGQSGQWAQGGMTATGQGSVTAEKHTTPFFHYEFSPLDRLRLHVGQRYGKISYMADDRTAANKDASKTYKEKVARTGVTYDLAPTHLVWASWGQTFNAPQLSTLLNSGTIGTPGITLAANLAPERSVTKEIGFRGRFADLGLRYDVTLFQSNNRGYIVARDCTAAEQTLYNAGATCKINENAGELTAKGIESMITWAATSWLDLGATFTSGRVFFNSNKSSTADYTGHDYQAAPRQHLNLRVGVKPAAGWLVELEGDHLTSYYVDNANTLSYARPDLYNLRASYVGKQWSFWLHALNITDKQYATRVSYTTIAGQNLLAASAGQGNAGTYMPLTVRVGVSYRF
ncbi:MAG TPA: TonB-dependent receptor [Rhodocyclaceae bacterium]